MVGVESTLRFRLAEGVEAARVRVYRTGGRRRHLPTIGWLIGKRPLPGHKGETKQYFAWGLNDLTLEELIELAHFRWIVERFYQDAKGELGLDDYEGRLWLGLHRPSPWSRSPTVI